MKIIIILGLLVYLFRGFIFKSIAPVDNFQKIKNEDEEGFSEYEEVD